MKLGWNFIRSLLHDTKDVQHVGIGNIVGWGEDFVKKLKGYI